MSGESGESRTLEETPTWAVAAVCGVFITIGLVVVIGIKKIENRLNFGNRKPPGYVRHRKPLVGALQKMKEELMLLGFISLLLAVFQNNVANICVASTVLDHWAPCHLKKTQEGVDEPAGASTRGYGRRLLPADSWPMTDWVKEPLFSGRILAGGAAADLKSCKPGHESLISTETLHQLHTYLFVLAGVHIGYSLCAMLLASTKVKGWRQWEKEAHTESYDGVSEISKSSRLHRQTTFLKYSTSKPWSGNRFLVWAVCFFRQFGNSVVRSDYLTLRFGFTSKYNIPNFDFHRYMLRSLEDEFRKVAGISVYLWFLVILLLLFNTAGTNLFFWLSIVPTVLVLLVGAKLQHIIATLALEYAGSTQSGQFVKGALKPRDELFWFSKPQLVLHLIHFSLFQNAFEMATIVTVAWQFGWKSCLLHNRAYFCIRIGLGVFGQILCSYSTLPLYALVTQMGSDYKQAIFEDSFKNKMYNWGQGAKDRIKLGMMPEEMQDVSANYEHGDTDSPSYSGAPMFEDSPHGSKNGIRFEEGPCFCHLHPAFYPKGVRFSDVELGRSVSAPSVMKPFDSPRSNFESSKPSYSNANSPHTSKTISRPDSPTTQVAALAPEITFEILTDEVNKKVNEELQ